MRERSLFEFCKSHFSLPSCCSGWPLFDTIVAVPAGPGFAAAGLLVFAFTAADPLAVSPSLYGSISGRVRPDGIWRSGSSPMSKVTFQKGRLPGVIGNNPRSTIRNLEPTGYRVWIRSWCSARSNES